MRQPLTIYSLPPELLVETFQHLAELEPLGTDHYAEDDNGSDAASSAGSFSSYEISVDNDYKPDLEASSDSQSVYATFSLGWARVTHVCSLWRKVAINSVTLWSTLPLDLCPDWVDELLERSQDTPLDLYIPELGSTTEYSTALLESQINIRRIRRIICDNPRIPVLDIIAELAKITTPPLERIDLAGISYPIMHLNIFKSLRRVDVLIKGDDETFDALSGSIDLPLLTELGLTMMPPDRTFALSDHWAALLKNLITLQLNFFTWDFKGDVIELPRLRELKIFEAGERCGTFVQHSRTPSLRNYSMNYTVSAYPNVVDLVLANSMGFARVFEDAASSILPLHTLTLTQFRSTYAAAPSGNIEVHGWRCAEQTDVLTFPFDDRQMAPVDADISHSIGFARLGTSQLSNFAVVLLGHPALSTLRMLSLDLHPDLELGDTSSWIDLLQPMRHLRHLRISSPSNVRGSPVCILEALRSRRIDDRYVVAALERLTLVDWDPDVGRRRRQDVPGPFPGAIIRDIALNRPQETPLNAIHIVSWRYSFGEEWWRKHLSDVDGVKIVYERLFLPLDHVHAAEQDPDSDLEEAEEGNSAADNGMNIG